MAKILRQHPHTLCSLAIIRDRSDHAESSAIRSTAVLTVTRCRKAGARFAIDHAAFDRSASRAEILDCLAAHIPIGATVIAHAPPAPQHYFQHAFVAGSPLPPADLQLLQRERGDLDILPLECPNRAMVEITAAYEIDRAGPSSNILLRSRKAPEEAECLWLAFLWANFGRRERTTLSAAWQGWKAIERARPVRF